MHAVVRCQAHSTPAMIVDGNVDAVEWEDDRELGEQRNSPLDKVWEMVWGVTQDQ